MYNFIKLLHILSAIVAIGFNLSYTVWVLIGKKEKKHLLFALKGIKFLDDRFANPSYIFSFLTGLLMCYFGQLNPLNISWLKYPLILFSLMGIIAFGIYTPTLSKQIKILETQGSESAAYKATDKKQTLTGLVLFVLAISVVAIMVIKPNL